MDPRRFDESYGLFRSSTRWTDSDPSFMVGNLDIAPYSLHGKFMNRRGYDISEVLIALPVQNPAVNLTVFIFFLRKNKASGWR